MDANNIRRDNDEMEKQLRLDIKEGEEISGMIKMPGWKLFEDEMKVGVEMYIKTLETSADEKKIFKAQGANGALKILLDYTKLKIEAGKEAKEKIEGKE